MVCLLVKRSDTKFNVQLGGFRSQFQASDVSSHTEEFWYNETVCLCMIIYIYKESHLVWYVRVDIYPIRDIIVH